MKDIKQVLEDVNVINNLIKMYDRCEDCLKEIEIGIRHLNSYEDRLELIENLPELRKQRDRIYYKLLSTYDIDMRDNSKFTNLIKECYD